MGAKLKDEIKQSKPFASLEQEAALNIQRTSSDLMHAFQQQMKGHGLTASQYNVLRILRGASPGELRCSDIGERMVGRDPDITRLLHRLEREGLIKRRRDAQDRRVVYTRITGLGLQKLKELDPLADASSRMALGHLCAQKLETLIALLEEVRQGIAA